MSDCTCPDAVIKTAQRAGGRQVITDRHERRKVTDCPVHGHDDDAIDRDIAEGNTL